MSVVLVLRALGLGDLLTAVPALRGLRRAFPRASLVLACPTALHPLVRLWGLADQAVDARELEPLPAAPERPDLGVNLHGRGPESTRLLLEVEPRALVAFAHDDLPETEGQPHWRDDEHEVMRWCRLLAESGVPARPDELALTVPPPGRFARVRGRTVLHPGAASEARRWPVERWVALARRELAAGWSIVLTGSSGERERCLRIARAAGLSDDEVLAGRTSLPELAAVVGAAGLVVANDTGAAHLATALGTPSVVLFGPTSPKRWGPPPGPRHLPLWAGRTGDPHADVVDAGLLDLSVDDVASGVARVRESVGSGMP